MNTKVTGDIAESKVITRFLELGFRVSIPFGDNYPYDIIVEYENKFFKIQIKNGRYRNGCVKFRCDRTIRNAGNKFTNKSYIGEVDFFAVYCDETKDVYLISVENSSQTFLRVEVSKTKKQLKNVRWAKDYELTLEKFEGQFSG